MLLQSGKYSPTNPTFPPVLLTVFAFSLPKFYTQKHSGALGDANQYFVTDFRWFWTAAK